ncbi:MAG: hypothetical protein R3296_15325, partial [Oleiphilaceae bacterium]|nr:hypothetical protein [Oleiphilaceae bacterium]
YRVQGLAMGMATDSNRLLHFADATLTITGTTTASLTTEGLEVVHTVSTEEVTRPSALASSTRNLTLADLGNGRLSLTDGTLVLEGFITPDQEQLFLRLSDAGGSEQQLGLLMATRLP